MPYYTHHYTHRTIVCRSSAKVNLSLDVVSRRDDGYHELRSVIHTIALWDSLSFDFRFGDTNTSGDDLTLRCDDAGLQNDDNLCLKAARLWLKTAREESGRTRNGAALDGIDANAGSFSLKRFSGARITLQKAIPHGAGLGGGSGNAAATLLAFNRCFNGLLDESLMQRIALALGADVPFFLRGGCALMEGIGEHLTPLPTLNGWLLVAQPDVKLSTPRVFAMWDKLQEPSCHGTIAMKTVFEDAAKEDAAKQEEKEAETAQSATHAMLMKLAKLLRNDLSHAAENCGASIEETMAMMRRCGALQASMSGSGSAVFGLFDMESAARRACREIASDSQLVSITPNAFAPDVLRLEGHLTYLALAPFCARGVHFDSDLTSISEVSRSLEEAQ